MEILIPLPKRTLKAVLFDFDGTLSTLRCGWEQVMEPLMIQVIGGGQHDDLLVKTVREYIDASTGIQTIFQMDWLCETAAKYGKNKDLSDDPWIYKAEYNKRLTEFIKDRKRGLEQGDYSPDEFLMSGSMAFLEKLKEKGIKLYMASGTDHQDVLDEAELLKVRSFFDHIAGAPAGRADCSKEAVLKDLISGQDLKGEQIAVIGDGKVEIALGKECGAMTLGLATDEQKRTGVNPVKRQRLITAGAHAISGDFSDNEILNWLGID